MLRFLETARFDKPALDYLATLGLFSDRFLRRSKPSASQGDVYAMPEGTPLFANEPVLEVVAPLPQAQLVETFLLNQFTLQTTLAPRRRVWLRRRAGTSSSTSACDACTGSMPG